MKFKTLRTSETGKKLAEIEKKFEQSEKEIIELLTEIGAENHRWRPNPWQVRTGLSSIMFPSGTEVPKHFKEVRPNEYMPKLNTKEGKRIYNKIKELTKVERNELNSAVNFDGGFNHIGFNLSNDEYYLFSLYDNWEYTPPEDCEEITVAEYNQLIGKQK